MSVGVETRTSDCRILSDLFASRLCFEGCGYLRARLAARLRPDSRPGADCAVQGRKAQKRPTRLTGGFPPPPPPPVTAPAAASQKPRTTNTPNEPPHFSPPGNENY